MVARSESKAIKVGMTTILSGRVAQLGTSSRNAVMMEVEKINAAGGLAGRQIEMVIRNSKASRRKRPVIARELINTEGCELLIDAEASVRRVRGPRGRPETSDVHSSHQFGNLAALSCDPKRADCRMLSARARQGVHDSIVGGSLCREAVGRPRAWRKWRPARQNTPMAAIPRVNTRLIVKHFTLTSKSSASPGQNCFSPTTPRS